MAIGMDVKFSGIEELRKSLQQIPEELQKKVYRKVVSKGAQVIAKATKANAKRAKDSGALTKSIGYSVSRDRKSAKIGARRGFGGDDGDPVFYAKNVEFGTSVAAAHPYARPAVDSSESKTMAEMAKAMDAGLTTEIVKLERKNRARR